MCNYSLQTGSSNVSNLQEEVKILETVKTFVHLGAFLVTGLLTCLILITALGTRDLRRNGYYILLCQHCVCVTGFNMAGAVLHGLRVLQAPTARLVCWLIFDVQVALARCLMLSLTCMAMNVSLSICFPLRFPELARRWAGCVMLVIWTLALLNPVLFTILACVQSQWEYLLMSETHCSTTLDGFVARMASIALLCLIVLFFVESYIGICLEGCRRGHFSPANNKAKRTICIHALQLSLHLFPSFIIIARVQLGLTSNVVNFLVFCGAQSLSPVVYGLRCYDIRSQVPNFLPQFLLPLWNWFGQIKFRRGTDHITPAAATSGTEV